MDASRQSIFILYCSEWMSEFISENTNGGPNCGESFLDQVLIIQYSVAVYGGDAVRAHQAQKYFELWLGHHSLSSRRGYWWKVNVH